MFPGFVLYLEAIRMLVARPPARLRVEKEPLLVFFADVLIQVLSQSKLTVKLRDRSEDRY